MKTPRKIVVIGCSGTGALAAMTLKKLQPDLDVTILREPDEEGLLTRCATPYICCGNVMVEPSYKDDAMFTDQNIRLVNSRAEKLDNQQKEVTTAEMLKPICRVTMSSCASNSVSRASQATVTSRESCFPLQPTLGISDCVSRSGRGPAWRKAVTENGP